MPPPARQGEQALAHDHAGSSCLPCPTFVEPGNTVTHSLATSDRVARLDEAERLRPAAEYRRAREILWPAVSRQDVATILEAVNPALLRDLPPAGGSR